MTRRDLPVAVSWDDEVVTVADDRNLPNIKKKVIGITYDGKALFLTESQAVVKKQIGRLWKVPICQWPWPDKAPAMRRKERRRA